jgi:hypothetical protein
MAEGVLSRAGQYSFNPRDIQPIPAADRALGLVGRCGCLVVHTRGVRSECSSVLEMERTPRVVAVSRSTVCVARIGRCIDLCDMVNTFFSEIPRDVDQIPVDVHYSNPPKP